MLQPDLGGREHRITRACPTGPSTSAASRSSSATARRIRSPRIWRSGASSTCAGSSSARSRRCSARTASSRSARSSISRRKGPRSTTASCGTTSCVIGCCLTSTRWPRDTYHRDGTIMRGLAMDFTDDPTARNVRDEYLFGKAFLVAPVYQYQARVAPGLSTGRRRRWYDFHTGAPPRRRPEHRRRGAAARMPLFVRAGSIVPVGPEIQYTAEKPGAPITLLVFTGADGSFELYEDDGVSYGYERGEFARIPLRYDAAKDTLTIGARSGSYKGMPEKRTFRVRWIQGRRKAPPTSMPRPMPPSNTRAPRCPSVSGCLRFNPACGINSGCARGCSLLTKGVHRGKGSGGRRSPLSAGRRAGRRDRRSRAPQADSRSVAPGERRLHSRLPHRRRFAR